MKEGIIEHKDDVIQVQLDVFTDLIHTCNSQCLFTDKYVNLICHTTSYCTAKENTKHVLIYIPNNFSKPCIERL